MMSFWYSKRRLVFPRINPNSFFSNSRLIDKFHLKIPFKNKEGKFLIWKAISPSQSSRFSINTGASKRLMLPASFFLLEKDFRLLLLSELWSGNPKRLQNRKISINIKGIFYIRCTKITAIKALISVGGISNRIITCMNLVFMVCWN